MQSVVALACAVLLAACVHARPPHDGIALPRLPKPGERVYLEVDLGIIGSGQDVVVRTLDGRLVGTLSPHGIRPGNAAGTYVLPVPADMTAPWIDDGHLQLRFVIERAGAAPRTATHEEVLAVRAVVTGADTRP